MAEKYLVSDYVSYGKGDGEELYGYYVVDLDDEETRREIVNNTYMDDSYDTENFIKGEQDSFSYDLCGGDWDDPTGGFVVLQSKESRINEIKADAQRKIDEVEYIFRDK